MSFSSWLRNRTASGAPGPARRDRVSSGAFRPRLEALEGRDVPSILTVTNTLDGGAGSLRAEIAAASPGDTIAFDPALDYRTIQLTSGELAVTKSLTIRGPGAGLLTVSGGNTWRVFEVSDTDTAGPTVLLSGLTITGGTGRGGPIDSGGGVLNRNGSTLTIRAAPCRTTATTPRAAASPTSSPR